MSLWQEFPPEEQRIAIEVVAQEYMAANPECLTVQIVVVKMEGDEDYAYFFATCREKKGGDDDEWQKKDVSFTGVRMREN